VSRGVSLDGYIVGPDGDFAWTTPDDDVFRSELEWAALWKPLPKVVFSSMLSTVQGNARLALRGLAEDIEQLRAESGRATSRLATRRSRPKGPGWV
jgi:hypothetical protein